MILIEKTQIMGLEPTIRGMRNPMNSWDKSDSGLCNPYDGESTIDCEKCTFNCLGSDFYTGQVSSPAFKVGKNDLDLMMRLAEAGSVDGKFRRMIAVYVDITVPLYWWKEFDTYKVGTVANSCSTMHKIHAKEFMLEDFSHEHLVKRSLRKLTEKIEELNFWRNIYLNGGEVDNEDGTIRIFAPKEKDAWWQMIQLLPSSYNQKRTVMLNYEVLSNIYQHRRNHKLDEWRELCKWIEELPYSEVITCNVIEGKKAALKTFVDDTDATPVHGGAFDKPTDAEKKEIQELKAAINKLREQKWSEEQITKLLQRAADPANPNGIDHEG